MTFSHKKATDGGQSNSITVSLPPATSASQQPALTAHSLRTPVRRSQTAPTLSVDTQESNSLTPTPSIPRDAKKAVVLEEDGNSASEICLSPSWAEFGSNKKKKEKKRLDKEKKEAEKKHRKAVEQQKADEIRAGKRLSKRPPAAMDTQKASSGLRRGSGISFMSSRSSSQEGSGRSSREENRMSGSSIHSKVNFQTQSTPGTSTEWSSGPQRENQITLSSGAPQLPKLRGFGWHSRHTSKPNMAVDGVAPEKSLLDFAYRLEASTTPSETQVSPNNHSTGYQSPGQHSQPQQPRPPSLDRCQTVPDFIGATKEHWTERHAEQLLPLNIQVSSKENRTIQEITSPDLRRYQTGAGRRLNDGTKTEFNGKIMSDEFIRINQMHATNGGQSVQPSQVKLLKDGSSYVHKQRMHQQQLSIAGYQDELAVKDANENQALGDYAGEESMEKDNPSSAPSRTVSSESSKWPTRQTSIDCDCKHEVEMAREDQSDRSHTFLKEPRESTVLHQNQVVQSPRAEKILSFRRFQRKSKSSPSPATGKLLVISTSSDEKASHSHVTAIAQAETPVSNASKTAQASGERIPVPVESKLKASHKGSDDEAVQHSSREKPTDQSHEFEQTSPFRLKKDKLSLKKPMPRSSTAPVLPMTLQQTSPGVQTAQRDGTTETPGTPKIPTPKKSGLRGPPSPPAIAEGSTKPAHEVVVEGVTGEGLVHKTSIKRPRSNPTLQTASIPSSQLPSLDFLPQLKHQALVKPKRTSPIGSLFPTSMEGSSFPASSLPVSSSPAAKSSIEKQISPVTAPQELKLMPRSPLRPQSHQPQIEGPLLHPTIGSRRRTMSPNAISKRSTTMGPLSFGKGGTAEGLEAKPIAKLFVICCKCKFWHDLPSRLYELMALPQRLSHEGDRNSASKAVGKANEATLDTMVKCPWCEHYMTTWCCAGWTTVVYLHERHH